jgi:endonuclease/exonuclease/phosphatase family metal-dependent hydrolase
LLTTVEVADKSRTVAAIYETPAGPLLVYGTVMPWHSDRDPSDTENWIKHHRVVPEQAAEWVTLRRQHPNAALCVAGDLNMNVGGRHYYGTKEGRRLLEVGMAGAGLTCVTRTEDVPDNLLAKPHIDHVLIPADWAKRTRVVAAWPGTISGVRLSDHSGIVVEMCP